MKSFQLMGKTIKVVFSKKLHDQADAFGIWEEAKNTITIQENLNKDLEGHTFWHEVVHAILDQMGEKKLSNDEKFVDLFGGLLHQVVNTLK